MNFSLIKIGDRESPCWANAYQIWFKYEPGAFRPYSYLHFGYESQVDDVLLIILDIKGSSLHNGLPWTWFILINLCRLAWHLAVVSHTKITVDRWSDPMAHHPCGSNNLEKTFFFFLLRISSRMHLRDRWIAVTHPQILLWMPGSLRVTAEWQDPFRSAIQRGGCGIVPPLLHSKLENLASELSTATFYSNDLGQVICFSLTSLPLC